MYLHNINALTDTEKDEIFTKAKAMRELKDNWAFRVFINEIKDIRERAKEELAETKDDHRFMQGYCLAYKTVIEIPEQLIMNEEILVKQQEDQKIEKVKESWISKFINIGNDSVVR